MLAFKLDKCATKIITRCNKQHTLGERGYITSRYIVISLWFFKQFIQPETSGYMLSFFRMYSPLWSECRQQIHADHFYKENNKAISGYFLNENSEFFHNYDYNVSSGYFLFLSNFQLSFFHLSFKQHILFLFVLLCFNLFSQIHKLLMIHQWFYYDSMTCC